MLAGEWSTRTVCTKGTVTGQASSVPRDANPATALETIFVIGNTYTHSFGCLGHLSSSCHQFHPLSNAFKHVESNGGNASGTESLGWEDIGC